MLVGLLLYRLLLDVCRLLGLPLLSHRLSSQARSSCRSAGPAAQGSTNWQLAADRRTVDGAQDRQTLDVVGGLLGHHSIGRCVWSINFQPTGFNVPSFLQQGASGNVAPEHALPTVSTVSAVSVASVVPSRLSRRLSLSAVDVRWNRRKIKDGAVGEERASFNVHVSCGFLSM